ncbi:hypothetical protein SAMN05421740_10142 [Parapedobacter koreensis]|uniref:Uncharacterized protein n=1 Tax=Parapedobacter koreensis TaxID=332977 RepID=A0A1H7EVI1_9SPHI|nr:hypothetical protein SAMN05421740_10142 [Parapedobacter koreensis]
MQLIASHRRIATILSVDKKKVIKPCLVAKYPYAQEIRWTVPPWILTMES